MESYDLWKLDSNEADLCYCEECQENIPEYNFPPNSSICERCVEKVDPDDMWYYKL